MNTMSILKICLWLACAFHLVIGLGLNLSPSFPQVMAGYYGAEVDFTPQLLYILKPLGAFMIAIGIMAAAAARDPLNNAMIVYALVALFTMRALQRFVFQDTIVSELSIEASRNIVNAVAFLALAVIFAALFKLAQRNAAT